MQDEQETWQLIPFMQLDMADLFPLDEYSIPIRVLYKNWKGNIRERLIKIKQIKYMKSEYHASEGYAWFTIAEDLETNEIRSFLCKDITLIQ